MKPYYITTAIDYTNAPPHIGHAYEKVLADVMARFQRLNGREVYFLTGVDQHGQKVQKSAEKAGLTPQEFVDGVTTHFTALWDKLNVRFDGWAATTDIKHKRVVQAMLQKLHDASQLYKKSYSGHYSVRQEQFLTDKERGPDGNFGPEWGEVEWREEDAWYFKLSEHTEWLKNYIRGNPDFIYPPHRANDVLNALEGSSGIDLCISRPKDRLSWGIPLPFDEDSVNFVWFDALSNYISFAGYLADEVGNEGLPQFEKIWPADAEIIGKDILMPAHAVYWPIMLHALGFTDAEMPKLVVHGWWNMKGAKISKSLGNVIDPNVLSDTFTPDGLRYYLMRDIVTGKDADFDPSRLVMLYNTELANELGNLCNRALNMTQRFTAGILHRGGMTTDDDLALQSSLITSTADYRAAMDEFNVAAALEAISRHVVHCNGYAERMKPWELNKDPQKHERLATVLYHLAESVAHCTVLLGPILPTAVGSLAAQLKLPHLAQLHLHDLHWGLIADAHEIDKPAPVFPRIIDAEPA